MSKMIIDFLIIYTVLYMMMMMMMKDELTLVWR